MDWALFRREAIRGAMYTAYARRQAWVLQPPIPRDEEAFVDPEEDFGVDLDLVPHASTSSGSSYEPPESDDAPTDDSEPNAQLGSLSLELIGQH